MLLEEPYEKTFVVPHVYHNRLITDLDW
jgi:hypothetical protein